MDLNITPGTSYLGKLTQNQIGQIIFMVICAISQLLLGFASYYITFENDVVFAVFLPAGTSFLLTTYGFNESRKLGYMAILGIYIGAFLESFLNLIFNFGIPIIISFIVVIFIAGGNALQPFIGYYFIEKFIKKEQIFSKFKHVAVFFIGFGISCAIAALIGVISLNIVTIAPWEGTFSNLFTWWIADLAGVLVISPAGLVWYMKHTRPKLKNKNQRIRFHIYMVIFFIVLSSYFIFMSTPFIPIEAKISGSYLIIPIIIWAVFLFSGRMVFIIHLFNAFMFIIITLRRQSPFFQMSIANSLVQIQFFIIIMTLTTLVMFTLHIELNNSLYQLRKYSSKLEIEVKNLSGLLPICAHCKKIQDEASNNEWKPLEEYISEYSEAMFSHGLCPDCAEKYFKET